MSPGRSGCRRGGVPVVARLGRAHGTLAGARARLAAWSWPLLLAAAVWLGLFHGLGSVPLFDVDEGAFGEATREMLARGDYVSTWLNGQPRFDKPILAYWLQAASVGLFGFTEFALRLPSALAACAWIAAIHAFTRRAVDRGTARAAAFIAATSAGVVVIGRGATADALLNLFLALAMFDVYRELVDPRPRWRRRAFLWIGLGILAKGPVALLVPGAASAIAFLLLGRMAAWWRAVRDPVGWAILLAVAGPWYALEYARRGDAFLAGFFLRHNVERFLAPLQGHAGGPFYYLPALLLLVLPYTGLLLVTLPGLRRLRATPLDTLSWCWFLFVLAFFTLAGTKLPHYLLYGATPLFILMARCRHDLRSRVPVLFPALLFLAAVTALPSVLRAFAPGVHNAYVREALARADAFSPAWRTQALALLAGVLLLALWPGRRRAGAEDPRREDAAHDGGDRPDAVAAATGASDPRYASAAASTRSQACGDGEHDADAGGRAKASGGDVGGAGGTAVAAGHARARADAAGRACPSAATGGHMGADARAGATSSPSGTWSRLAAAALACSWALGGLLLPAAGELQQGPVKRAALLARDAGWSVRSWRIDAPSFSFYRGAVTPAVRAPRPGDVILTRSDALGALGPVRVLIREGGVVLVRVGG